MTPRLIGSVSTVEDALEKFRPYGSEPLLREADVELLLACFDEDSYSGACAVIFRSRSTGKLYVVEGSHCSCNSYRDDQWSPVETTVPALRLMADGGWRSWSSLADEFRRELNALLDEVVSDLEVRS